MIKTPCLWLPSQQEPPSYSSCTLIAIVLRHEFFDKAAGFCQLTASTCEKGLSSLGPIFEDGMTFILVPLASFTENVRSVSFSFRDWPLFVCAESAASHSSMQIRTFLRDFLLNAFMYLAVWLVLVADD